MLSNISLVGSLILPNAHKSGRNLSNYARSMRSHINEHPDAISMTNKSDAKLWSRGTRKYIRLFMLQRLTIYFGRGEFSRCIMLKTQFQSWQQQR